MDWNDDRIEALTKMWREGLSASQVARQLGGVSRSAVIGKIHRLGIAGRDAPTRPNALGGRPSTRARASSGGVLRVATGPRPTPNPTPRSAPRVAFEVASTATILTLTKHACRWPIGEPGKGDFGFCGRLITGVGSYCVGHASMAVRRRDTPMRSKEIERIVNRFVEGGPAEPAAPAIPWREIA
jgi:GcrA cell cycle regulator